MVTLETDGLRDYVVFPSGQKKILGAVSVLKFVLAVSPRRGVREALDSFNATGRAMVLADLDAMDDLFRPVISRFASENPLMGSLDRTPISAGDTMDEKKIMEHLGKIEGVVSTLNRYASTDGGLVSHRRHEELRALVGELHFRDPGDQSKNDAWYIDGQPKVDTVDPGQKIPERITNAPASSTTPVHAPGTKTASTERSGCMPPEAVSSEPPPPTPEPSFQNVKANTAVAEGVLRQVEETNVKIDKLAAAGRKFNASRAKSDLYAVASDVTEILNNVDLAQPWVRKDLDSLAGRSAKLHDLFASAKV